VRVRLCAPCLRYPGGFSAESCRSNLSLILSSWAAAHQISWLPFIALSPIGIILGEEIAVSHPHIAHSQRDRLTCMLPWGCGEGAKRPAMASKGTSVLRGGGRADLHMQEGNI
jgi:hypothetical protein